MQSLSRQDQKQIKTIQEEVKPFDFIRYGTGNLIPYYLSMRRRKMKSKRACLYRNNTEMEGKDTK